MFEVEDGSEVRGHVSCSLIFNDLKCNGLEAQAPGSYSDPQPGASTSSPLHALPHPYMRHFSVPGRFPPASCAENFRRKGS